MSIFSEIKSISIIGSYTIDREVKPGSDIDVVVVVCDIHKTLLKFENIFYKYIVKVNDSEGERIELNTKLDDIVLDVTIIDQFNVPNNPLTDWYENHLGWCEQSICIWGKPMQILFNLVELKSKYKSIRLNRLSLVNEKIEMTIEKITKQGRRDLHIIYELQKYIFIREIITRQLFNRLCVKHADDAIPNFNLIFEKELRDKCGLKLELRDA